MSLNNAAPQRGVCEVIREINDLFQGDTELDKLIRLRCAEAERMAKEMSIELCKTVKEYYKRWPENKDYTKDMANRKKAGYKFHKL